MNSDSPTRSYFFLSTPFDEEQSWYDNKTEMCTYVIWLECLWSARLSLAPLGESACIALDLMPCYSILSELIYSSSCNNVTWVALSLIHICSVVDVDGELCETSAQHYYNNDFSQPFLKETMLLD